MSTLTTTYGATTLTGSTIPTQTACLTAPLNNTITNPPTNVNAVFLGPVNNQTLGYMKTCCKEAPIVLYQDACLAYCGESTYNATLVIARCLAPNATALPGIGYFGLSEAFDDGSSSSTTSTSTSRPTTLPTSSSTASPSPSNGAAVVKSSNSILVTIAAGAMVLSWVMNGLA